MNNIIQAISGYEYSLFLMRDGRVFSCGTNIDSRAGVNSTNERIRRPTMISNLKDIVQIASGGDISLFLDRYGRVYGCGDNTYKQLGLEDREIKTPTLIPGLKDIVYIDGGFEYSIFISSYGRVYIVGFNENFMFGPDYPIYIYKYSNINI